MKFEEMVLVVVSLGHNQHSLPLLRVHAIYIFTVCPRSSYPFYILGYYIKWVTTSSTYSIMILRGILNLDIQTGSGPDLFLRSKSGQNTRIRIRNPARYYFLNAMLLSFLPHFLYNKFSPFWYLFHFFSFPFGIQPPFCLFAGIMSVCQLFWFFY